MPMMCPKCNTAHTRRTDCPACGTRLRVTGADVKTDGVAWQHTPLGRIVVGLLLSQGFALGLRMLKDSIFPEAQGTDEFTQIVWIQAVSGGCLFLAGMLTGAGQSFGFALGALVGFTNSLVLLGLQVAAGESLPEYLAISQPILHSFFGAFGGLVGSLIWRPLPVVRLAKPVADEKDPKHRTRRKAQLFSGPIAWLRVLVGSAIVVAGATFATLVVGVLYDYTPLRMSSIEQSQFMAYEIAALATLLGSCIAGVNTCNGAKQGLCVGLSSAAILFFIQLMNEQTEINQIVFTTAAILGLSVIGGWFGCRLFPPLAARKRKEIAY